MIGAIFSSVSFCIFPTADQNLTFNRTHKQKNVTPFSPGVLHVSGFLFVINRSGHNPTEYAHALRHLHGNGIVFHLVKLLVVTVFAGTQFRAGEVSNLVAGVRVAHERYDGGGGFQEHVGGDETEGEADEEWDNDLFVHRIPRKKRKVKIRMLSLCFC